MGFQYHKNAPLISVYFRFQYHNSSFKNIGHGWARIPNPRNRLVKSDGVFAHASQPKSVGQVLRIGSADNVFCSSPPSAICTINVPLYARFQSTILGKEIAPVFVLSQSILELNPSCKFHGKIIQVPLLRH